MHKFPKYKHLLKAEEFRDVFKGGKRQYSDHWSVCYLKTQREYPRLGLAIAKKAIKRATGRNLVKRIIREQFRCCDELPPMDIIFMAKKSAAKLNRAQLNESLQACWQELIK